MIRLAEPWAAYYGDSPALQTGMTFAHLAGVLFGGGLAIASDAVTLRAARAHEKRAQLRHISKVHRSVLTGLGITFLSGVLMAAADLEFLGTSKVFWTKMALIGLLLANGAIIERTESALNATGTRFRERWTRLQTTAIVSLALWFAVVLTGTMLVDAS